MIALRSEVPLLPVAITGSQRLQWPRIWPRPFNRAEVTVTIAPPFSLEKPARINVASADAATLEIMQRIAALLPEEYRGYYGSAPATESAAPAERSDN